MTLSDFLKHLFNRFVETYRKYFLPTLNVILVLTVLCFVIGAFLFYTSTIFSPGSKKPLSLFSFFFTRYSTGGSYNAGDSIKLVFIFFVSIFSIGLNRTVFNQLPTDNNITGLLKRVKASEVAWLLVCLLAKCLHTMIYSHR